MYIQLLIAELPQRLWEREIQGIHGSNRDPGTATNQKAANAPRCKSSRRNRTREMHFTIAYESFSYPTARFPFGLRLSLIGKHFFIIHHHAKIRLAHPYLSCYRDESFVIIYAHGWSFWLLICYALHGLSSLLSIPPLSFSMRMVPPCLLAYRKPSLTTRGTWREFKTNTIWTDACPLCQKLISPKRCRSNRARWEATHR